MSTDLHLVVSDVDGNHPATVVNTVNHGPIRTVNILTVLVWHRYTSLQYVGTLSDLGPLCLSATTSPTPSCCHVLLVCWCILLVVTLSHPLYYWQQVDKSCVSSYYHTLHNHVSLRSPCSHTDTTSTLRCRHPLFVYCHFLCIPTLTHVCVIDHPILRGANQTRSKNLDAAYKQAGTEGCQSTSTWHTCAGQVRGMV